MFLAFSVHDKNGRVPRFTFSQVDVFAPRPLTGNPVAVVHGADGLDDEQMAAFARWTNLSETTFLLTPTLPGVDYRLRIFTPVGELPFAGHPTLGSAHAWLEAGGTPAGEKVVQECGIGLVELRRDGDTLAFRAPELLRAGPLDEATRDQAIASIGVRPEQVLHTAWADNGPGWVGLVLDSGDTVRAIQPDYARMGSLAVGVLGPDTAGPADAEVRAFYPPIGEDPVTGSLNAAFAVWLTREGILPPSYTVRQGTALQRAGDVRIVTDEDGIWVGGPSTTLIRGTLDL